MSYNKLNEPFKQVQMILMNKLINLNFRIINYNNSFQLYKISQVNKFNNFKSRFKLNKSRLRN